MATNGTSTHSNGKNGKGKRPPPPNLAAGAELAPAAPKKGRRQQELPGTERVTVAPVEEAATEYLELMEERMALQERENAAREHLKMVMNNHSVTLYRFTLKGVERQVELEQIEKVKTKKLEEQGD